MAARGIGDDDTVVAYDDEGGVMAARLVWMRRVTGRGAALLDGGIGGWPGPLSTEPVRRPPAEFTARPWPEERLAKDRRGRLHRRRRHRRPRRRSLRRGRQPAFGSARRRTRTYRPGRTPPVAAR
jgi:3-mercaptopyruvate sulfurtransferase SseA